MKVLTAGGGFLFCASRCLHRHSNSPASQSVCMEKDRQGLVGGREHEAGDGTVQERGGILKGCPLSATLAKGITQCCRLFSISG